MSVTFFALDYLMKLRDHFRNRHSNVGQSVRVTEFLDFNKRLQIKSTCYHFPISRQQRRYRNSRNFPFVLNENVIQKNEIN